MAELAYRKLSDDEIQQELASATGWQIQDGMLTREFSFDKYKDGVVFAAAVGWVADKLDHHPDLLVTYGKVRISVNTHSVEGISPYDFELARRINGIA